MTPDRDVPPADRSIRGAFEHINEAILHIRTALLIVYTSFRSTLTVRPLFTTIWNGLFGTRQKLSAIAALCASVSAVVTGLLVTTTYGYSRIEYVVIGNTQTLGQWVIGIWAGTGPQPVAILGIVLLVAVSVGFSAKNSGIIPTILLAMGPVFGIGLARYGMTVEHFSPSKTHRLFGIEAMHFQTIGPIETVGTALFLACVWGIPIGITGYIIGVISRRSGLFGRRLNGNAVVKA